MAVFISTTFFGDNSSVFDVLKKLHEEKINKVEIGSNHKSLDIQKLNLYKNTTYIIHNYFPPMERNFVLNIASADDSVRQKSINFIKKTIKICRKLNIKFYTIHPGFRADMELKTKSKSNERNFDLRIKSKSLLPRRKIIEESIKIIGSLTSFAKANQVQLLVENQGSKTSKEAVIFDSIEEIDMLAKYIGRDLRLNLNIAHTLLSGINLKNKDIFYHLYKRVDFFEVSEISGVLDSHLPVLNKSGRVFGILNFYSSEFSRKNLILEYRNVDLNQVKKSYDLVKNLTLKHSATN